MKNALARLALAALAAALLLAAEAAPATARDRAAEISAASARLRQAASAAGVRYPLRRVEVLVEKGRRVLTLYAEGVPLRAYWVGLGFAPFGHKMREGDGKTPEGDYYICSRNNASRFHRFLGLSYPSPSDAAAAYADGRIDARTLSRLYHVRSPNRPAWNTPLGGVVGIHGGGAGADWTLGCVALANDDVDEIWVACQSGAPVRIEP